jgi:hypothetical protein
MIGSRLYTKGIMHSRVSFNSYNINAQVNNNLKTMVKRKPYRGGMHWYLPLLRNNVSFLVLHEC